MFEGLTVGYVVTGLIIAFSSSVLSFLATAIGFWLLYGRNLITREEAEKMVEDKYAILAKFEHTLTALNNAVNQLTVQMAKFQVALEYMNKGATHGSQED